MALTVLAVADEVHGALYDRFEPERWRNVDLILSSGDLPPEYLDFLATRLNVPVFYVRGNHDGAYGASRFEGFENLHGRIVEYQGLRFAGFEGSRLYNGGPVQYSERHMSALARRSRLRAVVRGVPDIIVTHAPPHGCHDGSDRCHRGFDCFERLIRAWKPELLVHGHVHDHYGREPVSHRGSTAVVNAFPYRLLQVGA